MFFPPFGFDNNEMTTMRSCVTFRRVLIDPEGNINTHAHTTSPLQISPGLLIIHPLPYAVPPT